MASSFDDTLPPEIRLEIYALLLTSEHRLTRATSRQLRKQLVNTSILECSKLMYKEAVEVLYDVNQFAVPLRELCENCEPALAWEARSLQAATMPLTIIIEDCRPCCLAPLDELFLHTKHSEHINVRIRGGSFSWEQLAAAFRGRGSITFQQVGDFELAMASQGRAKFSCSAIAGSWDYVADIAPQELESIVLRDTANGYQDVEAKMAEHARALLVSLYNEEAEVFNIPLSQVPCWSQGAINPVFAKFATKEMVKQLNWLHEHGTE